VANEIISGKGVAIIEESMKEARAKAAAATGNGNKGVAQWQIMKEIGSRQSEGRRA